MPEALIVGKEREFLNWFYSGSAVAKHDALPPESVNEYLRTFSGAEGVLGALGVYRTAFTTMAQTLPLTKNKVKVPVVAIGEERDWANTSASSVAWWRSMSRVSFCPDVGTSSRRSVLPQCSSSLTSSRVPGSS